MVNANNTIDNKLSVLLAVSAAITIFAAERLSEQIGILGLIGLAGLITACILTIIGLNLKVVSGEVNSTRDQPGYYWLDDGDFVLQLIDDLELSTSYLQKTNSEKASIYWWSIVFFSSASVVILLSSFVEFYLCVQKG